MPNAIKALIERQAATTDACCSSRVLTASDCGDVHNSFLVDDLRLSHSTESEHRKLAAILAKTESDACATGVFGGSP